MMSFRKKGNKVVITVSQCELVFVVKTKVTHNQMVVILTSVKPRYRYTIYRYIMFRVSLFTKLHK